MLKLRTLTPLIIIALYLTSAAAWANNIVSDLAHYSFKFETGQKANLNHILTATPLNSVRLEQILAQSQNYQEFLTNLFRLEPDLKNQHVLLFDTGSIQFASSENPRVLTFGKGSVLAFSEPPNTADRRIEIMEFKPDSGTFEFHEIAFKNGARPEFRKNPTSCLACHGEQPKPLWVPYDFWSNMYGSRIGRVGTSAELSAYLKVTEKTHGVYSQLQYVKPAFGERTAYLRQTELFNQYLSTLNMVRIQHLLKNKYNAQFRPIYNAFMAGLNYCFPNTPPENIESELASYLPEGLQSRFAKKLNEV